MLTRISRLFLAGGAALDGFVHVDATVAVHFDVVTLAESDAPDGYATPQCPNEDR